MTKAVARRAPQAEPSEGRSLTALVDWPALADLG